MISLVLLSSLLAGTAMAADAATEKAQGMAADTSKPIETISNTPGTAHDEKDCPMQHDHKNCPMHKAKSMDKTMKDCKVKQSEPCPYHQDKHHPGNAHEKCDHEKRN